VGEESDVMDTLTIVESGGMENAGLYGVSLLGPDPDTAWIY
jgi:hypothetical protein